MSSDNNFLRASIQGDDDIEDIGPSLDDTDPTSCLIKPENVEAEDLTIPEDELPSVDIVLPPKDRYWTVYLMFYFLGITTLLPWNFFINVHAYWLYKFRDVNNSTTALQLRIEPTQFQSSFFSYLSIASNVPSTLAFMANAFIARWLSANLRITVSLGITFLVFVLSTVLVRVDTDSWQYDFFILTMVTVVLMNTLSSFFQCGLMSTVSHFPKEYTTATLSGQALGGIFAAVANILSIFLAADDLTSAFLYFLIGTLCLFVSFLFALAMPKILYYKFYLGEKGGPFRWMDSYAPETMLAPRNNFKVQFKVVFRKVWVQAVTAMMVFLVTLAVFPTLMLQVVSENPQTVWNEKYYIPVVTFLLLSIGDYVGRILSGALKLPSKNSYWTLILSIMRIAFIPMIMTCNLLPRTRHLPVIFESDIEYAIISTFLGLTNGYLANIVFINASHLVRMEEQEEASSIVTLMLGVGLSFGVSLSYFLLMLI